MRKQTSTSRRVFGLTLGQLAVLTVLAVLILGTLGIGGILMLNTNSRPPAPQPQVVSTSIGLLPSPTTLPTATAAHPTATPTPISLSEIELETLLLSPADFPGGVSNAEVRDLPDSFGKLPSAANSIYKYFQVNDDSESFGLHVTVLLYEDDADIQLAYSIVLDDLGEGRQTVPNIGQKATVGWKSTELLGSKVEWIEMAFVRCHALAHIKILFTPKLDYIRGYGERLDGRLAPIVCR
jgi:hypothetical protein